MKKSLVLLLFVLSIGAPLWSIPLKKGEKIELTLKEAISGENVQVGSDVFFNVEEDVKAGDQTVIRKGTEAYGQIVEAVPATESGKAGKVTVKGSYVTAVDGQRIPITFTLTDAPKSKSFWGVWTTGWGRSTKGLEGKLKQGTAVIALVDQDVNVLPPQESEEPEPQISINGGNQQIVHTSAFFLKAHIANANKVEAVAVNDKYININKGPSIDIFDPLVIKEPVNKFTIILRLFDGKEISDDLTVTQDPQGALKGKIVKSDHDGIFINLGSLNGVQQDYCFIVYDKFPVKDENGKLLQMVERPEALVRVAEVFKKVSMVQVVDKLFGKVRVNDLIK